MELGQGSTSSLGGGWVRGMSGRWYFLAPLLKIELLLLIAIASEMIW
jgi:hypothetical protein